MSQALPSGRMRRAASALAALPSALLFGIFFALVALGHLTLLRLPYYWDEGGYYIPAALDFFHSGKLIPYYTNAHPPLPSVILGTFWHMVGYHILATRLLVCAFAAAGLVAVFRLAERLVNAATAAAVTLLTSIYPIWFVQSSLAHADIFAAVFVLWALAVYLPIDSPGSRSADPEPRAGGAAASIPPHSHLAVATLFSLAVLSKETAIVQPLALAILRLMLLFRDRRIPALGLPARRIEACQIPVCKEHLRWIATLLLPLAPLLAWYVYHRLATGFMFGNPEFLRYNATANLTLSHLATALRYRFLHLFWQRNIWLPIVFACACLLLPRRPENAGAALSHAALRSIAVLIAANWIFFSVLGGALLTRYLLPVYPLTLLVCIDVWRTRTARWPLFTTATAAAFLSALWLNPPTSFAPEDNLTYRNMIVVQQDAIAFVSEHYPEATVLTAWPVSADLFRPELGYVTRPIHVFPMQNFTLSAIRRAAQQPGRYDTAIAFTTHFLTPAFQHYLLEHPNSYRGREFAATRDLRPAEIAALLGGRVVWMEDRAGEWAAVLRFDRSYDARLP